MIFETKKNNDSFFVCYQMEAKHKLFLFYF